MSRFSVSLPKMIRQKLQKEALTEGVSEAEILRRIVAAYYNERNGK